MNRKKILLVDDEQDILEIISYNLEKEGYHVFTASNGNEGIAKAKEILPDLILLDVMMPEKDGIETCQELRKIKELQKTLIVFLSARKSQITSILVLILIAPVGQTTLHCPQFTQSVSAIFLLNAGVTRAFVPRYAKSIALTDCTLSHIRTQSPQRIHLFGSRTIDGELKSSGYCSFVFSNRTVVTPIRCASA